MPSRRCASEFDFEFARTIEFYGASGRAFEFEFEFAASALF
jgi:hypothetical protein